MNAYIVVFMLSFAIGWALKSILRDVVRELEREEHKKTVIEQGQEIARLRAQVALIIGKEKQ